MSVPFFLCLIGCVGCAVYALYARRLDRMDDYHLMHGPKSGCVECEGK